jgi:hypothetical protein
VGIVSNLATFVTALATMVTAAGTLLTVRQMKAQMEASYRPELTFARAWIKAETEFSKCPVPIRWIPPPPDTGSGTIVIASQTVYLQMCNVGLGAATSVRIQWNFPVLEMIDVLNALSQRALIPVYFKYEHGFLSQQSDIWPDLSLNWAPSATVRNIMIDYILPEKEKTMYSFSSGAPLQIPRLYIHLVSSCLYFNVMQKSHDPDPFETPPLNAVVSYHDIAGRKHEREFNLRLHVISLTHPTENEPMTFDGYIEAEKITAIKTV